MYMCGRMNIIDDPISRLISEIAGMDYRAETNHDFRPTQMTTVLSMTTAMATSQYQLHNLSWGIHPNWSPKLIINARSESILAKPTFAQSFKCNRIVVPCSGWYEWVTTAQGSTKTLFKSQNESVLLMAGIGFPDSNQFVTMTQKPNDFYAQYHHRRPLLISRENLQQWLSGSVDDAYQLAEHYVEPELDFVMETLPQKQQNFSLF